MPPSIMPVCMAMAEGTETFLLAQLCSRAYLQGAIEDSAPLNSTSPHWPPCPSPPPNCSRGGSLVGPGTVARPAQCSRLPACLCVCYGTRLPPYHHLLLPAGSPVTTYLPESQPHCPCSTAAAVAGEWEGRMWGTSEAGKHASV